MTGQRDKLEAWKYLVDDFLEIACLLDEKEREFLIGKMVMSGGIAGNISSHPAFSISGKLFSFTREKPIQEVWIYDGQLKEIKSFKLIEATEASKEGNYRCSNSLKHWLEKENE